MWREPRHRSGVITNSHERSGTRVRERRLLIFSARIFDSSVERGVPSRAAAPDGPNTRPPVARTASSMSAFSCEASAPDIPSRLSTAGRVDIQLSSTVNSSVSDTITDRSMTFCSSRDLRHRLRAEPLQPGAAKRRRVDRQIGRRSDRLRAVFPARRDLRRSSPQPSPTSPDC